MTDAEVQVVRSGELAPAASTPGMDRREAFSSEGFWMGTVTTSPGVMTGWHHHGEYDSYIFVSFGTARIEYGPGAKRHAEADAGDSIHIPPLLVHREGTDEGSKGLEAVVIRVGRGEFLFNLEAPEQEE